MNTPAPPQIPRSSELPPELRQAIDRHARKRVLFWGLLILVPSIAVLGITGGMILKLRAERRQLRTELERLKNETIRFDQPLQIHNPAWGTVIDGVDPKKFPSRDPKDPRRGALLQQFLPNGNPAQVWLLRPVQSTNVSLTPSQPTTVAAYTRRGFELLHRDQQPAFAIETFEACVREHPDSAECFHGLAQAQRERKDYGKALGNHNRAIELDPQQHLFYWERGITYLRMNDADNAIIDFKTCLEKSAAFANAENGLGQAYRIKGEFAEALAHHDKAIALEDTNPSFYRERGLTYQSKGDQEKASADLAKANQMQQQK
jgi:tetratricopeptide (TPR) repeat protein